MLFTRPNPDHHLPFFFGAACGILTLSAAQTILKQNDNIYLQMVLNLLFKPQYIPLPSILLNYSPSQTPRWINLGCWHPPSSNTSYADACTSMVNLVKAQLSKINHDYVIDVGCGNGDSLRCWDKPSVGVNITPREVELAKINGDCILGDAEDKDCIRGIIEARGRDNRAAVAAVDCAYHFSSRSNFFKNCKDFGFDVVVTDVVLKDGHGWLRRKLIEMACKIAGIPRRNVLTKREYREVLENMGYRVDIQSVPGVFSGFSNFAKRQADVCEANGLRFEGLGAQIDDLKSKGIFLAGCEGAFEYLVITAKI